MRKAIYVFHHAFILMFFFLPLVLSTEGSAAGNADSMAPAVSFEDVDLANCAVVLVDSADPKLAPHVTPAEENYIRSGVFGINAQHWTWGWPGYRSYKVKEHPQMKEPVAYYRLAFKKPMAVGACTYQARSDNHYGGAVSFFFLKPDATYPGDPLKPEQWQEVKPAAGQNGPFVTFPPGVQTRALLMRHQVDNASAIGRLWLFRNRLFDLRHTAIGQGERCPGGSDGMVLTQGRRWVNVWPRDENSRPDRHPITDIEPSWVILSWDKPVNLCGFMCLAGNVGKLQPFILTGEARGNPALFPKESWKKLAAQRNGDSWSFAPMLTNALKLRIDSVEKNDRWPFQNNQVAVIDDLRVLTDLGDAPAPDLQPSITGDPPFNIRYELDCAGDFCLAVDDAKGCRVQNIVAQVPRAAGKYSEPWDLKGVDGQFVPPGKYKWKAIVGPHPDVKYEMSLYPNISMVAPHNSPWLNGPSGSGGWLADHSGNSSITTFGGSAFVGAYCAESGVALIETDLDGVKKWGRHNLAAWAGPQLLANDGANIYAVISGENEDNLWLIDEKRETHDYLKFAASRTRLNGIRGIAASADGKLWLAVASKKRSWLNNAFSAADVDMEKVLPLPPREAKGGRAEDLPDPRFELLRMLRVAADPPGHPHKDGMIYFSSASGPERKQHIMIPFREPVPIGSVVFSPVEQDKDYSIRFSVAKPDAPYPPNPEEESQWAPFDTAALSGKKTHQAVFGNWNVLPAPEKTVTRALRVSFVKGGEDELLDAIEKPAGGKGDDLMGEGGTDVTGQIGGGRAWAGRLEGIKILRRRFASLASTAKVRVNSGKVDAEGVWDAQRSEPLSPQKPGIYVMEWEKPQKVRGLAIKEIDGEETRIDVYTGPDGGPVEINGDANWKEVATYHQGWRYYYQPDPTRSPLARYIDGYVDFGDVPPTRAVRLRIVRQWLENPGRPHGIREDRGGRELDPKRCRVWGVAPVEALGGEAPVDPLTTDRLEVRDIKTAKLERELPSAVTGAIHFSPKGRLLALSGKKLVEISPADGAEKDVISDLLEPSAFAVDAEENIYVYDGAEDRQLVRVYDQAGKYLRDIGAPGGWKAGKWNPERMQGVVDMAVDSKGQLWIVESAMDPKRVTMWTRDGKFIREMLGNTGYGGGGILDRYDKTRLRYGRMEFVIDWESGKSKLDSLNFLEVPATGGHGIADLFPVRSGKFNYLVSGVSHPSMSGEVGFVFVEEGDTARLAAALGSGAAFEPLSRPEFEAMLQGRVPADYEFLYADRNEDGKVQPEEVTLTPVQSKERSEQLKVYGFEYDLGVCTSRTSRFEPKEILPKGTPVLEERPLEGLRKLHKQMGFERYYYIRRLRSGSFFVKLGSERTQLYDGVIEPDGVLKWRYPVQHEGVQSLKIFPWRPGGVVHQFIMIGNETIDAGGLGEVLAINSNCGQWNLWTADGLLFSQIFLHQQNPAARLLNFPEHDRGMFFENLTMGQEHFSGSFTKTEADGKTYVVCGHNHITIAEVAGWGRFKRLEGEFNVTEQDIEKARAWDVARAAREVFVRAPLITANRGDFKTLKESKGAVELDQEGAPGPVSFNMAYDDKNLYVSYRVHMHGPLKNTGNDPRLLFKSGAAVDLKLGTNPDADPRRDRPERGDIRILMTTVGGKPFVVMYDAVNPDAPKDQSWEISTPAGGKVTFDRVVPLPKVDMIYEPELSPPDNSEVGYSVMAAIPLDSIGLKIIPGIRIKADWGILVSDNGSDVRTRRYWADVDNNGTSDAPSEARLTPSLWGYVEFAGAAKDKGATEIDPDAFKATPSEKDTGVDELDE